jgi:hypothetical protein
MFTVLILAAAILAALSESTRGPHRVLVLAVILICIALLFVGGNFSIR